MQIGPVLQAIKIGNAIEDRIETGNLRLFRSHDVGGLVLEDERIDVMQIEFLASYGIRNKKGAGIAIDTLNAVAGRVTAHPNLIGALVAIDRRAVTVVVGEARLDKRIVIIATAGYAQAYRAIGGAGIKQSVIGSTGRIDPGGIVLGQRGIDRISICGISC